KDPAGVASRDEGRPRRSSRATSATDGAAEDAPVADSGSRAGTGSAARQDSAGAPANVLADASRRWRDWSFGELPELLEVRDPASGATMVGFPALVDDGDAVAIEVFDDPDRAASAHREGMARLFALALREPLRFFAKNIPEFQKLSLLHAGFGDEQALRDGLVRAVGSGE